MKMRVCTLHIVFWCATLLVVTTLSGCDLPWQALPPEGPYYLSNITPEPQGRNDWCVPATAKIWRARLGLTPTYSQAQIWDYFLQLWGFDRVRYGIGIVYEDDVRDIYRSLTNLPLETSYYSQADVQIAIGDQVKGLQNNQLTSVGINNGTHTAFVTGARWLRLSDLMRRPLAENLFILDPANGILHAPMSPEIWMYLMATVRYGGGSVQWQVAGQRSSSRAAVDRFDSLGGTYYGTGLAYSPGRYRYDGNGNCYWEPNQNGKYQCVPGQPPPPPGGANVLEPGERLYAGSSIHSPDGRFQFAYQTDGNLVLYGPPGAIWATMTFDSPGYLEMQGDGNLVMYNSGGAPIWHTNTSGNSGARLVLQSDGNVVLYYGSFPLWATDTGGW